MSTKPLTKKEEAWLRRMQKALNACPSKRLGFYTIGDADISIYDRSREDEINALMETGKASDFCVAVEDLSARLGVLDFPFQVHSTAG